jgi:ubiquinone/menaquinone biosynthesis C-methylase UbiE
MTWRLTQAQSRESYLKKYSAEEVETYEKWVAMLTHEDHFAYLQDMQDHCLFTAGQKVLDVGAGTGGLTTVLNLVPKLHLTALEPSPEMLKVLQAKTQLAAVECVQGFCDHPNDRTHFLENSFDVIASRQLFNGLYDPIAALENAWYWLKPNGFLVATDGFYDRSAWSGVWEDVVDQLPLSACRTLATIPYLMEHVGFRVHTAQLMQRTNQRPNIRTQRYIIVASKTSASLR